MKGKIVLVTGAKGGLGSYVTRAMLDPGATVVGVSRKIQQSQFSSSSFVALPAEISSGQGATAVIDTVIARFGKLDAVIHKERICRRQNHRRPFRRHYRERVNN
jgi:NAD(P)-dependent dehydrogenase (short-subunit alcohol dehydrogenase family)